MFFQCYNCIYLYCWPSCTHKIFSFVFLFLMTEFFFCHLLLNKQTANKAIILFWINFILLLSLIISTLFMSFTPIFNLRHLQIDRLITIQTMSLPSDIIITYNCVTISFKLYKSCVFSKSSSEKKLWAKEPLLCAIKLCIFSILFFVMCFRLYNA